MQLSVIGSCEEVLQMPKKTVSVQWTLCNGRACFGITDGKRWFYYGYTTFGIAASVLKSGIQFDNKDIRYIVHQTPIKIADVHAAAATIPA
jgi:hypothetical protein